VRDIAGAVGMRSGSPFYHFANKQEILKAVMEEGLRQGLERTHAAIEGSATPRERFRALVRTHYRILHDEGSDFIAVMLHDWRSLPPRYKREIVKLKDRYDGLWEATLAELIAGGLIGANPPGRRYRHCEDLKTARLMISARSTSAPWYESRDWGRRRDGRRRAGRAHGALLPEGRMKSIRLAAGLGYHGDAWGPSAPRSSEAGSSAPTISPS
jgi:AcrR family transcriptional regulator